MAQRTKKRSSTRSRRVSRRRRNLSRRGLYIAGATVVAAAAVTYGGYRITKALRAGLGPRPLGPQGSGSPGSCGPNHPGFVRNEQGVCVPTKSTPGGLYIDADCQDFVFVKGEKGNESEQTKRLDSMIETARVASLQAEAKSADPTEVVEQFLRMTWPNCDWPPPPTASMRIKQLFSALSILVGRLIVRNGGRVLGTMAQDLVDEQVAERLEEIGLPPFSPDVVPEIELPFFPVIVYPVDLDGPGPELPEDEPGGGGIDLPPGGQDFPGQQGDDGPPECAVLAQIRTITRTLPSANFASERESTFKIWSPTSGKCDEYAVAFGVCIQPTLFFGYLDPYVSDDKPADTGEVFFRIRQTDGSDIGWQNFETPVRYKAQFRTNIQVLANGNISIVGTPKLVEFTNDDLDPCTNKVGRWPQPSATFFEVEATDGKWKNWRAIPRFSISTQGKNLMLKVKYSGLPRFAKWDEDTAQIGDLGFEQLFAALGAPQGKEGIARLDSKTPMSITVKVWSGGKE